MPSTDRVTTIGKQSPACSATMLVTNDIFLCMCSSVFIVYCFVQSTDGANDAAVAVLFG